MSVNRFIALSLVLGLVLVVAVFTFQDIYISRMNPVAQQGQLDVRSWDFDARGPVELEGDWAGNQLAVQVPTNVNQWSMQLPQTLKDATIVVNGVTIHHHTNVRGIWSKEVFFVSDQPVMEIQIETNSEQISSKELAQITFGTLESMVADSRLKAVFMAMGRISLYVFALYYLLLYFIGKHEQVQLFAGLMFFSLANVTSQVYQFHFISEIFKVGGSDYLVWVNRFAVLLGFGFFGLMLWAVRRGRRTKNIEPSNIALAVAISWFLIMYVVGIKVDVQWAIRFGVFGTLIFMNLLLAKVQAEQVQSLRQANQKLEQTLHYELAFLQAQIKPHFLYNALSTIVAFCFTNGARAAELLRSLSHFLRFMFEQHHADFRITIQEELELIQTYVMLEEARFEERLRYALDIDPSVDVEAMRIPSLLIQPLVENAIRHGLFPKPAGGTVRLKLSCTGNVLHVLVEDDGVGMSKAFLTQLLESSTASRGVGLGNVRRRLDQIAGSTFEMMSEYGFGTRIQMDVPLES